MFCRKIGAKLLWAQVIKQSYNSRFKTVKNVKHNTLTNIQDYWFPDEHWNTNLLCAMTILLLSEL